MRCRRDGQNFDRGGSVICDNNGPGSQSSRIPFAGRYGSRVFRRFVGIFQRCVLDHIRENGYANVVDLRYFDLLKRL